MKNRVRLFATWVVVFVVFIYSAMQAVPALADDGLPPAETPAEQPAGTGEPDVAEVFNAVPEGTEVVVTNAEGQNVPLATSEASTAMLDGDPIWCPAGVAPKGGTGGCSPVFDRFGTSGDVGSLIDWLTATPQKKAGTIWVEHDYDDLGQETLGAIVLDGSSLSLMSAYALTVQGGWIGGTTGSKALYTADPYSYFNSTLAITGWAGAVTLNNIVIDGVHTNVADGTQTGLLINTTGNITLNDVTVQNSYNDDDSQPTWIMAGASLNNSTGSGNVVVNNSTFFNNEGEGVHVYSAGMVTINGLISNANGSYGAYIDNTLMEGKAVTLKGFKQFNGNGEDGLVVLSAGTITLSNLIASNNGGFGVVLSNTFSANKTPSITLSGTNFAMNNDNAGMMMFSYGAITASNLNASGNGDDGVLIDNCSLSGPNCIVIAAKAVKLTGTNTFNGNGGLGLDILSFGAISVSNLTASDNGDMGARFDNGTTDLNLVESKGTFTLSGYGTFLGNDNEGLSVITFGNAVLANITSRYNDGYGLHIEATKTLGGSGITLNGFNNLSNNLDTGAFLGALGTVTLNNITANQNEEVGVYVFNYYDPAKPYNVTIKGTNTFNENYGDGLVVQSYGAILVNNLMANGNGQFNFQGYGASLSNCGCATPKSITVSGYAHISNNYDAGLNIAGNGPVVLTNVIAEGNGEEGVYIDNASDPAKGQTVTLKGSNTFNHNDGQGLHIFSYGAITVNNITAFDNGAEGAYLDNANGGMPKNITLTGVNAFLGNYTDGLSAFSMGAVVLSRITADGNATALGNGITVQTAGSITLTCAATTNQAMGAGYALTSTGGGAITIKGIYSGNNGAADMAATSGVVKITKPCALP